MLFLVLIVLPFFNKIEMRSGTPVNLRAALEESFSSAKQQRSSLLPSSTPVPLDRARPLLRKPPLARALAAPVPQRWLSLLLDSELRSPLPPPVQRTEQRNKKAKEHVLRGKEKLDHTQVDIEKGGNQLGM